MITLSLDIVVNVITLSEGTGLLGELGLCLTPIDVPEGPSKQSSTFCAGVHCFK